MTVGFVTHAACRDHEPGADHPERPARLAAVRDALVAAGLWELLIEIPAPAVTREALLRVHDAVYLDELAELDPGDGTIEVDADTRLSRDTLAAAAHAAGAVVQATDDIMAGRLRRAFCAVRPPGHHAERARAMGFCFYNNLAVGVAHALAEHGLERIAIFDFDAHYGNGTEQILAGDERVLMASVYEGGLFPQTPETEMPPRFLRAELAPNAQGGDLRRACEATLLPALDRFRPELVFVSAGFDGHIEDELSHLWLREADFAWLSRELVALANRHAGGRIISVLEGGYALDALGHSAAAHVSALLGL